jgi:hypothetical protein
VVKIPFTANGFATLHEDACSAPHHAVETFHKVRFLACEMVCQIVASAEEMFAIVNC